MGFDANDKGFAYHMMDIHQLYGESKKILIVGTYPPPLGGISVFIYRLKKLLQKNNYEVDIYNTATQSRFLEIKFISFILTIIKGKYQVIHIQNFDLKKIIALVLLRQFKKYKIYYTDHNPFLFNKRGYFSTQIKRTLIPQFNKLIVVNNHILENYKVHKVKLPRDILVSNVFLPPPPEDKERILASYSPEINSFLDNHFPLVMANAFQLKLVDGIDLYGLDMCLELTKKIKINYPRIGFIFCLANEKANPEWFNELLLKIKTDDLTRNFYFMTGQKELWPLFERIQLFIRPTYKDGYGVSIDEALYFNCPAIASDACERNPQAIIFKNRDMADLYEKCIYILDKLHTHEQH